MSNPIVYVLAAVLMMGFMPAGAQETCGQLPAGVVSWWPGDGNANDFVDGNPGTLVGATFAPGRVSQAFSFDGLAGVVIQDNDNLNLQAFTIEAWVFPTQVDGQVDSIIMKEIGDTSWNIPQYTLGIRGTTNRGPSTGTIPVGNLAWYIGGLTGLPDDYYGWVDGGGSVPLNAWTHVALTFNGSTASTYINGRETRRVTGLSGVVTVTSGLLIIGSRTAYYQWLSERFNGLIDEVQIFSRAFSACEIRSTFAAGAAGNCKGDSDGDGVPDYVDNCPYVYNSGQADADGDGVGDACDCAPGDATVSAGPEETDLLEVGTGGDKTNLAWCSGGPSAGIATVYDIPRGGLNEFPVGTGMSETCLSPGGLSNSTATDPDAPPAGMGFWYLVRGRNSCATGTYGFQGHNGVPTVERITNVCP
jgi:hypothetical protein